MAIIVQADVSSEEQVREMFAKTLDAFGQLDVLINNAGIQKPAASHEIETADFDRILSVNWRGPFLCSREVTPINKVGLIVRRPAAN